MSFSAAANQQMSTVGVFVRNTFIDARVVTLTAEPRSSSAPPVCRSTPGSLESSMSSSSSSSADSSPVQKESKCNSKSRGEPADIPDEACSEASTNTTALGAARSDTDSSSTTDFSVEATGQRVQRRESWEESYYQPAMQANIPAVFVVCEASQPPPPNGIPVLSGAMPQLPSTRLRSQAKAFAPKAPVQVSKNMRKKCDKQFEAISKFTKESLLETGFVETAEVKRTADDGWCVLAHAKPEFFCYKETLMATAKEAMLKGAEETKSAFVIGYKGRPFLNTHWGFTAILGGMEEEHKACWDYYTFGSCHRGCQCRWQHPSFEKPVEVMIKLWQDDNGATAEA